jgi:carbon monoxide dehydrogenase subunit G
MSFAYSQNALGEGVMTQVRESVSLSASPTDVWSYIGDFDRLDSWHPAVASSEASQDGTSKIRHLTLGDGSIIVERLDSHDEEAQSYTYTIVDAGPLPVRNYQSTIEVTPDGTNAQVTWSSEFEALGAPEGDAQAAISGVYTGGFAALIEKFGTP